MILIRTTAWRSILLTIVTILFQGSARPDAYSEYVLAQRPVAYWRLNETEPVPSDVAANQGSLGSAAAGLYLNDPVRGVAGALASDSNSAAAFNGRNAHVRIPWSAALNPAPPFTIEAWVKPAILNPPGISTSPLASLRRVEPAAQGWVIYQTPDGWNVRLGSGPDNYSVDLTAVTEVETNLWYHIVATCDGATTELYLNGERKASTTQAELSFAPNPAAPMGIGARGDAAFPFNGAVDEVAVYPVVLSATHVLNHYRTGTNSAPSMPYAQLVAAGAPLAYFRLDEVAPTFPMVRNLGSLASAVEGTYRLGTTTQIPGPRPPLQPGMDLGNTGAGFDGSSGTVEIPPLNLNTNSVTIAAWIRRVGEQADHAGIVFTHAGNTTAGLNFQGAANQLGYQWQGPDLTKNWNSGLVPPDGQWAFVALVVEPSFATLYLHDGTSLRMATNAGPHELEEFDGPLFLGLDYGPRFFRGAMDEVVVFDRALTLAEVVEMYSAAVPSTGVAPVLTRRPTPTTVFDGDPLELKADAQGSEPLAFQWQRGGIDVTGATTRNFQLPAAAVSDTGTYRVRVSNGAGAVESAGVPVDVLPVPTTYLATNDLVMHLKLDGALQDSSGLGHDGAAVGDPEFVVGQIGSGAVRVVTDAADTINYVTLGSPVDLQFGAETSFSVGLWVKLNGLQDDTPLIANNDGSGFGGQGFALSPTIDGNGPVGGLTTWLADAAGNSSYFITSTAALEDGWHHVLWTVERGLRAITYVDGIEVDQSPIAGLGNVDSGLPINLGQDGTGVYAALLDAELDDVGIWRRILTPLDARAIFLAGKHSGASFDSGTATLSIGQRDGQIVLQYLGGVLEVNDRVDGPFAPIPNASSPYPVEASVSQRFYRVR